MTAAHAYELPDGPGLDDLVRDVADGNVVYLTRRGERIGAVVPTDQAWYWTPEWQAGEHAVDADAAAGNRGPVFRSDDEFLTALERAVDDPAALR